MRGNIDSTKSKRSVKNIKIILREMLKYVSMEDQLKVDKEDIILKHSKVKFNSDNSFEVEVDFSLNQ